MKCDRCKHEIHPVDGKSQMGESVVHRFPDRCAELLRLDLSRADARVESLEALLAESRDMRDKYLSVIECSNNTAHRRGERVAALEAENAALREDQARLDWLGQTGGVKETGLLRTQWIVYQYPLHEQERYDCIREAIDAARKGGA